MPPCCQKRKLQPPPKYSHRMTERIIFTRIPATISSAMIPHPPGSFSAAFTGKGFRMSKILKRKSAEKKTGRQAVHGNPGTSDFIDYDFSRVCFSFPKGILVRSPYSKNNHSQKPRQGDRV